MAEKAKSPKEGCTNEKKKKSTLKKVGRKFGYLIIIIINIVFLYIIHSSIIWKLNFLKDEFSDCLWAMNLSIGATVIGNFALFLYDGKILKLPIQIVLNVLSIIVIYTILIIFPFDFKLMLNISWINTAARICLILGIIGTIIAIIVQSIKLIFTFLKMPVSD